jgi:hypothetical protein
VTRSRTLRKYPAIAESAIAGGLRRPSTIDDVAGRVLKSKQNAPRVEELLDALLLLGTARELEDGRFLAMREGQRREHAPGKAATSAGH